jgi:hypothetical protein
VTLIERQRSAVRMKRTEHPRVALAICQAALMPSARKANLYCLDNERSATRSDQQRIIQTVA